MFAHYRTKGFVIKKADRGESDQIFTIYTQDFGKIEVIGRAIKKITSKLRAGIEIFYLSEIEFIQGKSYKTLTDAVVLEKNKEIQQDTDKLESALLVAGAIDRLVRGQERDEKIWDLLPDIFKKINNASPSKTYCQIAYYYFLWNLFSILGYHLDLYRCAVCGKKLSEGKNYLNVLDGGITGAECSSQEKGKQEITPEIIKILRIILKKDWQILEKIKGKNLHLNGIISVSEKYLECFASKNA
jgi:DNA repair protein RecO (recombination protein O)